MRREGDLDETQHDFRFTRRWFSVRNLEAFRTHVLPRFGGKPCIYLEIGVFEGGSASWMCQKVLTHPESRMVGIDTWLMTAKRTNEEMDEVRARAYHNLSPWMNGDPPKCQLVRAMSADALRMMCHRAGRWGISRGTVDLAMIDGHHSDAAVLDDARYSYLLAKPGGVIIFDDVRGDKTKEIDHVERGMRLWLDEMGDRVRPIWSSRYMEAFEKFV